MELLETLRVRDLVTLQGAQQAPYGPPPISPTWHPISAEMPDRSRVVLPSRSEEDRLGLCRGDFPRNEAAVGVSSGTRPLAKATERGWFGMRLPLPKKCHGESIHVLVAIFNCSLFPPSFYIYAPSVLRKVKLITYVSLSSYARLGFFSLQLCLVNINHSTM